MKKIDIGRIYKILMEEFTKHKVPVVELIQIQTKSPFKVLVATILSARTKDETTVKACKKLFSKVNSPEDFDKYSVKEIEDMIYPVGFFHNKALYLKELPRALNEKFAGKIPSKIEDLVLLAGVGRKTANLVRAVAFEKPAICVDVHVHRITNRLGYVKTKTPFETEMALRKKLPIKYWNGFNSILVSYGQHLCTPISPYCSKCRIKSYCNKVGVNKSR